MPSYSKQPVTRPGRDVNVRRLVVWFLIAMAGILTVLYISRSFIESLLPNSWKIETCPSQEQLNAMMNSLRHRGGATEGDVTLRLDSMMKDLTGPAVSADNPELLRVLRTHAVDPPSPLIPKFSYPLFETEQAKAVDKFLKNKEGGFFVECGALDGERSSNTIYFEQRRGWTGLLIEMDPSWYKQIRGKNRKSYSINACISPYQYPIKMEFKEHVMGQGKLVMGETTGGSTVHEVYCFPFFSMMLALNRTHIDYFSLDVEGLELEVLKTIPFDKLDISVFTVEYEHAKTGKDGYVEYMKSQGYYVHQTIVASRPEINYGSNDYMFVKNGLKL